MIEKRFLGGAIGCGPPGRRDPLANGGVRVWTSVSHSWVMVSITPPTRCQALPDLLGSREPAAF